MKALSIITGCPLFILFAALSCSKVSQDAGPWPLMQAHAHNDYDHDRPLLDALEHGFTSVEADLILKNDSLFVAHDQEDIESGKTLQSLYLDPLFKLYKDNGERIFSKWPTVHLMIDFKTDADSTYRVLRPIIGLYSEMLTRWSGGSKTTGAVTIIISGNRPIALAEMESSRLIGIDGRADDLHKNVSADLFPWISENWTDHFQWRGVDEISAAEKLKLDQIVQSAHANGHLVRFWATDSHYAPARQNMWATLLDAGVDLINTDDLAGLAEFMRNRQCLSIRD